MVTFIAFLAATFAWVLKMPALLTVSIIALVLSAALYLYDKRKQTENKDAHT
tara:strand:- start:1958 stop:2113 length:156 start_codon:yes stop_codon:yes gene_type:complete